MTSPAQLEAGHHPEFSSCFWTFPDYRVGVSVLYARMQDGLDENDMVLALLKHRAETERESARSLFNMPEPIPTVEPLFPGASSIEQGTLDGSRTPVARSLRLLMDEFAMKQAESHRIVAKQIQNNILTPFQRWVEGHADRMQVSYDLVDEALSTAEKQGKEVARMRLSYEHKCRLADEAEDDARFAPNSQTSIEFHPREEHGDDTLTPASNLQEHDPKNPSDEQASLDSQKLKRRETLRQQFGFKSRHEDDQDKSFEDESNTSIDTGLKRSSSRFSSLFTRAVGRMNDSPALAQVRAAMIGLTDPRHIRLRRDAELAEQQYQENVTKLDELRCQCEEVIFQQYSLLQKWESDRVIALQKVLQAYNQAMLPISDEYRASLERTKVLAAHMQPTQHIQYLMDVYKTGPFRPAPTVFKPYYHDDLNALAGVAQAGFGMDLVSTAKGAALAAQETSNNKNHSATLSTMPTLPPVLHALLSALQRSYAEQARWGRDKPDVSQTDLNAEKRRIWLVDVPLHVTHNLRSKLIERATEHNAQNEFVADQILDSVDASVLAATVKLWALELDTPLLPYSSWDEIAEIYDAAEIRFETQKSAAEKDLELISKPIIQGLAGVLARLPKLHLACLDAWIFHLYKLVQSTQNGPVDPLYTSKLGLAIGRAILRPSTEQPSTVFAKYPTLLVKDLVEKYEELFPPLMHSKAKESDMKALSPYRNVPIRRRSTLVDQRISRSSLQRALDSADGLQRRAAQYEQLHGARSSLYRHSSVSYRPTHDTDKANRAPRNFTAQASMQSVPTSTDQISSTSPNSNESKVTLKKFENLSSDDRQNYQQTASASSMGSSQNSADITVQNNANALHLSNVPKPSTKMRVVSASDNPDQQQSSLSTDPTTKTQQLSEFSTNSPQAKAHDSSAKIGTLHQIRTAKIESHRPELIKSKRQESPISNSEAAPLKENRRRLPKPPISTLPTDMPHESFPSPKVDSSSSSDASLEDDFSDYEDDPSWSQGTVNDADWELSRGDFTKQYNKAKQMAAALQTHTEGSSSSKASVPLPALNRPRPRAQAAAPKVPASDQLADDSGAHASKTAAQVSSLAQYASRIHIGEQYDPSMVAGGSVDARVPRKTNQLEENRRKDKADRATLQQVLDPRTLLILYKMIRRGLLEMVNGCVSTGKEANVYHATLAPTEEHKSTGHAAIKIYKTSILVFKDRDRYVSGEFRFRHGYSRHNPRKMVRLWAEKEMRNLKRLANAGIRAPAPIELRDHVLVMQFLGDNQGWPSARLKDAESSIPNQDWPRLYCELLATMRLMYQRCRLVHADLSEYNILYHEEHLWIIDVSQSVEHDHPHAFDFLREDISHIESYFGRHGVKTLGLRTTFHFIIRETSHTRKGGVAGLEKQNEVEHVQGVQNIDVQKSDDGHHQPENEASLIGELEKLMQLAEDDSFIEGQDQDEHEDAVFRQSYIPRNLDELYDPERDAELAHAGQANQSSYALVSGLNEYEKVEHPRDVPIDQPTEGDQLSDDAVSRKIPQSSSKVISASDSGSDDGKDHYPLIKASQSTQEEDASSEDEDQDSDAELSDRSGTSATLDPEARRQLQREERKEHKKEVKASNRERRKHKMPKAEKKKKMKKANARKK
ncbi:non-specific serine/threonine protein kinase [Malassezia yamatoensis]|uniref:Serine/threonine-protein kinase RIO1 n=1 Tax=Malassezia yamatoensis TaxID=253288 RepID=A0AAJ5YX35_9BASI|nr:non-specific serine/threonine protein kinase [Malassezia yamatoensis]